MIIELQTSRKFVYFVSSSTVHKVIGATSSPSVQSRLYLTIGQQRNLGHDQTLHEPAEGDHHQDPRHQEQRAQAARHPCNNNTGYNDS